MQASQPALLSSITPKVFSKAEPSQAELYGTLGAALGSAPLDNQAFSGAQQRKEWTVGLIAPSATESTCSHEQLSQVFNKAKPLQAELRGA